MGKELGTSEIYRLNFSIVPLPRLPAALTGIRLLARYEVVQGDERKLK